MNVRQLPFFQHIKWHPDRTDLRRFAISMLIGFTVLGLIVAWRAHHLGISTFVMWGIGIGLAAASASRLGRAAYLAVYLPSTLVGYVLSQVVLSLMFFLVFVPLGLVLRLLGKDLLQLRPQHQGHLWRRLEAAKDLNRYYRQF